MWSAASAFSDIELFVDLSEFSCPEIRLISFLFITYLAYNYNFISIASIRCFLSCDMRFTYRLILSLPFVIYSSVSFLNDDLPSFVSSFVRSPSDICSLFFFFHSALRYAIKIPRSKARTWPIGFADVNFFFSLFFNRVPSLKIRRLFMLIYA